jgi:hypothetical protein
MVAFNPRRERGQMNSPNVAAITPSRRLRWLAAPLALLVMAALAACNGRAVVTLTSTPSTDTFLAYRVGLSSVALQTSSGSKSAAAINTATTVDLAQLVNLSEVIGAASTQTGNFKQAVVTLDYSNAQIVYDNGTAEGVQLTPLGPDGQKLGKVSMTLYLDPSNLIGIVHGSTARLSLAFNLAASNVVNATAGTVTVTPMMSASAVAIDSKTVRIRGPISNVSTSNTSFTMGVEPFDFNVSEGGSLNVNPSTVTTYEINGTPSTGTAGINQLATVSNGTIGEAFGTLTVSSATGSSLLEEDEEGTTGTLGTLGTTGTTGTTETCSDGTTPQIVNNVETCTDGSTLETSTNDEETGETGTTFQTVSFSATQVLAGSSVQGGGFDRVSGIVTGRSGNTLTIDDATVVSNEGANTFVLGTATVNLGANTSVTQFGAATTESNGLAQISVGSLVYAFGTATDIGTTGAALDASAGRARVGQSTATGSVVAQPSTGGLELNLTQLGGRSLAAFDFSGTGSPAASPSSYMVAVTDLDLTNATVGEPVEATGYVSAFGSASSTSDFSAQTLLDYTTINATLVVDYTGTSAPFAAYSTTEIELDAQNNAVGSRHEIQTGSQVVNIVGIASDPLIVPNSSATTSVFTIGHAVTGSYESFNTFSAFITQLQTELTGAILVTGVTAVGQYTSSTYTFSASSMTITLYN